MSEGKKKKHSAKEIASSGAYGAVLIVLRMIVVACGAISPYVWLFITHPLMAFITAPVFMLLVSKTKKPGAFFLIDLIFGLIMTGATWMIPVCMAIGGLLCELCLKKGKHGNGFWTFLGYFFFNAGLISEFFPLYLNKESYLAYVVKTMSTEYAQILGNIITSQSLVLILILELAGSFGGYLFGKKVMTKHFRKAGLA